MATAANAMDGFAQGAAGLQAGLMESALEPGLSPFEVFQRVGVLTRKLHDAIQAADTLKVKFADPPALPAVGNMFKAIRDLDAAGQTPARVVANTGDFDSAYAAAPIKLSRSYKVMYQGGASPWMAWASAGFGPMPTSPKACRATCAVAPVTSTSPTRCARPPRSKHERPFSTRPTGRPASSTAASGRRARGSPGRDRSTIRRAGPPAGRC